MNFRIDRNPRSSAEIARVLSEQMKSACAALEADADGLHEGVHDARKAFKKIRAVLRLVRPQLGARYRDENAWFRDRARTLSGARDAQVLTESWEKYGAGLKDDTPELYRQVDELLNARREKIAAEQLSRGGAREELVAALPGRRRELVDWPLRGKGFNALAPGLEAVYRRARKSMRAAYAQNTPEAFHDWRKQAKYHWYHCRLLRSAWPAMMKSRSKELEKLADLLGDEHDLTVLCATLSQELAEPLGAQLPAVLTHLGEHQKALRDRAHPLGARLFAEPASVFGKRLRRYWEAGA